MVLSCLETAPRDEGCLLFRAPRTWARAAAWQLVTNWHMPQSRAAGQLDAGALASPYLQSSDIGILLRTWLSALLRSPALKPAAARPQSIQLYKRHRSVHPPTKVTWTGEAGPHLSAILLQIQEAKVPVQVSLQHRLGLVLGEDRLKIEGVLGLYEFRPALLSFLSM